MTFWLVRGGRYGEYEQIHQDKEITGFGWNELPNLSNIKDRDELKQIYLEVYPTDIKRRMTQQVGQIWSFLKKIQVGDLIGLPLKLKRSIVIGEITGDYEYEKGSTQPHRRKINWLKTISRSEFDQDILYSLGAFLTVGRVKAENAEQRVREMLEDKPKKHTDSRLDHLLESTKKFAMDYDQVITDEITKHLKLNFRGHKLAKLINEILEAKGFVTKVSSPGPDGGVDILAGSGPLGFESPRICVQVKSSETPSNVNIVRELDGVVKHFKADYGLLVAWGGLNTNAEREIKTSFFSTKVWEQDMIVDETIKYYEKFSDELKAEIPLKRIWILVEDSSEF